MSFSEKEKEKIRESVRDQAESMIEEFYMQYKDKPINLGSLTKLVSASVEFSVFTSLVLFEKIYSTDDGSQMEKLYTCEEVAERYSVNTATVKEWIRSKQLPAIKLTPKIIRIREVDLLELEKSKLIMK